MMLSLTLPIGAGGCSSVPPAPLRWEWLAEAPTPPSWKRNTAFFFSSYFLQLVLLLLCILQGEQEGGGARQVLPLERTGSVRQSWTRKRWNSSRSPESCWTTSSWQLGLQSSGLHADAPAPAQRIRLLGTAIIKWLQQIFFNRKYYFFMFY